MRLSSFAGNYRKFLLVPVVGLFLCSPGQRASAQDMTFRLAPVADPAQCDEKCPLGIAADGEITETSADAFLAFIQAHAGQGDVRSIVLLNSQGGKVVAAMELGHTLRRIGAAVIVARAVEVAEGQLRLTDGRCFSACVYALMGGRRRVIPPQSRIGIHRMVAPEAGSDPSGSHSPRQRYDDGDMRSKIAHYSRAMGVSEQLIMTAETTPHESIRILSQAEIKRWRLGVPKM